MLDWGAPHLLWILPAVWLAALVLHLYFRRRRMVVRFSDLEFFLRDEHHPAMRRRLRDLLKLLVRFLILTLPVLAVAQPRLRGIAPPGSGAVRRAIVLDDSFSMERKLPAGESAFQEAQRTALALLDGFDDGGETALFFTSARPGVLPTADRDKVRRAIREAKTASHAGTLSEALAEAVRTVRDGEVFLLSDFQKSTLGSWNEAKEARVYALPLRGARTIFRWKSPDSPNCPDGRVYVGNSGERWSTIRTGRWRAGWSFCSTRVRPASGC